ncbi:MAG: glycosyltransferase [Proteobacteria bacterium]|nr:MAG: glycosyltransferase [Pseudomonadota bacterium]
MNIMFVHQNMPGQFKNLAPLLAGNPANKVVFVTKRKQVEIPGVRKLLYKPSRGAHPSTHHYLRLFENSVLHGQQVVRVAQDLRKEGFVPDVIVAHPGWGESLFLKDVFPNSPLLSYCEYYYQGEGGDVGFEAPASLDQLCRLRARNAHLLSALEACDQGWSPTEWQRSRHPEAFLPKIEVVFDGIDTDQLRPDENASFTLPSGEILTRHDEVITYVARNLEPYRGFPTFMRALPKILERRPNAKVVVVGGDEVSYGAAPGDGLTWRQVMMDEVSFDTARVHFVGTLPYERYVELLQVSKAHLYLTVPFVLSWSFMEAMAAGCVIVGSRTRPVEEVLRNGENGFLTDFFSPDAVAADLDMALDHPDRERIRAQARQTVLERYQLRLCIARQMEMLNNLAETAVL